MFEKRQNKNFSFKLTGEQDIKRLMEKLLDFEEAHLGESFENVIYIEAYYDLKFCIEELILNVFKHGQHGDSDNKLEVEVVLYREDGQLRVEITDNARHFNIVDHAAQPSEGDEGEELTLGVKLIKKLTDDLRYDPLEVGNKVTFIKQAESRD